MSTTTANLGLIKPERSDNYSVNVMGENMDIIDARITALETGEFESANIGSLTADSILPTQIKVPANTTGGILYFNVTFSLSVPGNSTKTATFTLPNCAIRPIEDSFSIPIYGNCEYYGGSYEIVEDGVSIKTGTFKNKTSGLVYTLNAKVGSTYVVKCISTVTNEDINLNANFSIYL